MSDDFREAGKSIVHGRHTDYVRVMTTPTTLLVGTRKGVWTVTADATRSRWTVSEPHFLGHIAQHVVAAPRADGTILAAMRTGPLGPTVMRSTDNGATWVEASR